MLSSCRSDWQDAQPDLSLLRAQIRTSCHLQCVCYVEYSDAIMVTLNVVCEEFSTVPYLETVN